MHACIIQKKIVLSRDRNKKKNSAIDIWGGLKSPLEQRKKKKKSPVVVSQVKKSIYFLVPGTPLLLLLLVGCFVALFYVGRNVSDLLLTPSGRLMLFWLVDWLIGWVLIGRLVDWLSSDRSIGWLVEFWLIGWVLIGWSWLSYSGVTRNKELAVSST